MNGESAALRDSANRIEKIFAGTRARFHVDNHIGRNNFRNAAFDAVAGGVGLFEAGSARDADGDVNEVALAGAAQTDATDAEDAFDFFRRISDCFL